MRIESLTKEEIFKVLSTTESGLSDSEAKKRLLQFGTNEIKTIRKTPLYMMFLSQLTHFLAILLWISAFLCFLFEYLNPGEGLIRLGIVIIVVILINALFTFIQEYKAEKTLLELMKLLPYKIKVIRDNELKEIDSKDIVPGDIIYLSEGDKISADCRVIKSNLLKINKSTLTGESDLKPVFDEPFFGDFYDSPNILFAGTFVTSGNGTAVVFATGMSTEFGKIAHITSGIETELSPLKIEIKKLTKIVALFAISMGIIFFFFGQIIGKTFWENFLFAIGIIIANVPEGLLPTVTLALAMASQRMAKKNALIKKLTLIETLGSIEVICTDKTGTLTQNKLKVHKIWTKSETKFFYKCALYCNSLIIENAKTPTGDPLEVALFDFAKDHYEEGVIKIKEIPFDSDRKIMTTVNKVGDSKYVFSKGAFETLFPLCKEIEIGRNTKTILDAERTEIYNIYNKLMEEGLKVIALAYKKFSEEDVIERDLIFLGFVGFYDPPRPEVYEAIRKCKEAGIKIIMITGDAGKTAEAIAKEINLVTDKARVIERGEFLSLKDKELFKILDEENLIFARMTPLDKLRIVTLLKDKKLRVAVTGDGVNDAPALKRADIGIAMGITGTDVAKESAGMVLLDDNFATIVNAIEEGRAIFENIRSFVTYIFSHNIPEIVPYILYVIFKIPLPLTIMQILAVDLGTDLFPALALGAERPSQDIMKKPPRKREERLLTLKVLIRAYLILGPIEALCGLSAFFLILYGGGWIYGQSLSFKDPLYLTATSACLAGIIITQIANVFTCRSYDQSIFKMGFFSNKLIIWGIFLEIFVAIFIFYTPIGNKVFQTSPINPIIFIYQIPFAIFLLAVDEIRKKIKI